MVLYNEYLFLERTVRVVKYEIDRCALAVSVRELCYLACRHGDLGSRSGSMTEQAKIGREVHTMLQNERGALYNAEVALRNTTLLGGIHYEVSGRADGVVNSNGEILVEEIKTASGYEFSMPPDKLHTSQLICYAHFLCCERELDRIKTRLTYYNPENHKERHIDRAYSADELRIAYTDLLLKIEKWAMLEKIHAEEVIPTLKDAVFPYGKLRDGQRDLINESYSAMKRGKRLFAQAPTGTGKTISALYPAVKAVGSGIGDKIFYLTAKSSTSREAYRAVGKLFEAGARLKTVVIGAKEQVCLCEKAKCSGIRIGSFCNGDDCEFARGYYDRVDGAIFELLSRQNGYNLQIIKEVAVKHRVCPYELSLDLSKLCDVVICDYNYLFSPSVYMRRYFAEGAEKGKYIFLIDEAHNLPDRARDMYSTEMSKNAVERAFRLIDKERDTELYQGFERYILTLYGLRRLCKDNLVKEADGTESGFYMSRNPIEKFGLATEGFAHECEEWLKKNREHPLYNEINVVYSAARSYLLIMDYYDDKFLTYVMVFGGDIKVRLYCLDPSDVLNRCMNKGVASMLFSATLTPMDYFTDILGGGKQAETLVLPTPFKQENLFVATVDSVSTRYDDRNDKTYKRIVAIIASAVSARPGNYIVYFPSYSFMDEVKKHFERKFPNVKLIAQQKGMGRAERERFLSEFKEDTGKLRIGFCVLGGSFSEGVDLPGNKLIGTVIVGVGLPGLSNENNIIKEYYDIKSECGYDYAYTFPGMNNILQAAGRVIRTDTDKGIVILVDDRYGEAKYKLLFPPQWSHMIYTGDPVSLANSVKKFWEKTEK